MSGLGALGWKAEDYVQIQIFQALFDPDFPKDGQWGDYSLLSRTLAPIYAAAMLTGAKTAGTSTGVSGFGAAAATAAAATPSVNLISMIPKVVSTIKNIFGSSKPSGAEKRAAARKGSGPIITQVQTTLSKLKTMVQQRGGVVKDEAPPEFTAEARKLLHDTGQQHKVKHQAWRADIQANMVVEWAEAAAQQLAKIPVASAAAPSSTALPSTMIATVPGVQTTVRPTLLPAALPGAIKSTLLTKEAAIVGGVSLAVVLGLLLYLRR